MNPIHFSSKSDDWSTPDDFFAKVVAEFGPFDLDPCATAENAKAPKFYTAEQNGLARRWQGRVWCNPPYGRGIGEWVEKCAEHVWYYRENPDEKLIRNGSIAIMLLPARTDTKWWHDYVIPHAAEIRFIKGRLKFGGAKNSAPFPSALVIFRRKPA